jgi:hypothetical protein
LLLTRHQRLVHQSSCCQQWKHSAPSWKFDLC